MAQVKLGARFNTEEIRVLGDLAYERGTYTLTVSDKATGQCCPRPSIGTSMSFGASRTAAGRRGE